MATWDWELIGYVLSGAGLVIFTIGGLISMAQDPKHLTDAMAEMFTKPRLGYTGPRETPRSKWFLRIGFVLFAGGMLTLVSAPKPRCVFLTDADQKFSEPPYVVRMTVPDGCSEALKDRIGAIQEKVRNERDTDAVPHVEP